MIKQIITATAVLLSGILSAEAADVWKAPMDAKEWQFQGDIGKVTNPEPGVLRMEVTAKENGWQWPMLRYTLKTQPEIKYNLLRGKFRILQDSTRPEEWKVLINGKKNSKKRELGYVAPKPPANVWIEFGIPFDFDEISNFYLWHGLDMKKPGNTVRAELKDIELVRSEIDPEIAAKRAEWEKFRKNFKPDYSDGSHHLLPPETNRLAVPFPVVKDGKPAAAIFHHQHNWWNHPLESPVLRTAATELQRHIKMITGATLPINPSGKQAEGLRRIVLGKTAFIFGGPLTSAGLSSIKKELTELGTSDGYAIKTFGNDLAIIGACDRGVLNGVYALLENNTDLIWVRPNRQYGTVFTPKKDLDFVWGENVLERPATPVRGMWNLLEKDYYAANGCNTMSSPWNEEDNYTRGGHNVTDFVPSSKEKPEFHGLVNGKRGDYTYQLCFTNPEMKKVFTENALFGMRRNEYNQMAGLDISLDDSPNWCECENCSKPIRLADGTRLERGDPAFMSTQYFLFMNDVADALAREFPGKKIKTLAYFQTAEPPKCEISPNLVVVYCPYPRTNDSNPVFCDENYVWLDRAKRWYEKLGHDRRPVLYGYNVLGQNFPRAIAHAQQRDFKSYYPYIRGFDSENSAMSAYPDRMNKDGKEENTMKIMDWSAIELWVMMKLYWNPDQDVEQLYKRFCYRTFHEAAKPMERFYGILREEWIRKDRTSNIGEDGTGATKLYIIDAGHKNEMQDCLAEALRLVKHPTSKWLIERVKTRFDFFVEKVKNTKTSSAFLPLLLTEDLPDFDDTIWNSATFIDGFHDWTNPEKTAKFRTELRMFHDTNYVYFNFKLFENTKIFAPLSENGKLDEVAGKPDIGVSGSHIEIFLENMQKPGEYRLYMLGSDGSFKDYTAYDPKWNGRDTRRLKLRRSDDHWEAILKIPLEDVQYEGSYKSILRAGIVREVHQPKESGGEEFSSWKFCRHHQIQTFGELTLQR